MAQLYTTPEQVSAILAGAAKISLRNQITEALHKIADSIIQEIANNVAETLVLNLESYRLPMGANTEIVLLIDGVEAARKNIKKMGIMEEHE